jgi:hypothetical protein
MASKALTRQDAARGARVAQVLAVLLVAGTVGVVLLWPGTDGTAASTLASWESIQQSAAERAAGLEVEGEGSTGEVLPPYMPAVAGTLGLIGGVTAPEPALTPEEEEEIRKAEAAKMEAEQGEGGDVAASGVIRYLGSVGVGAGRWGYFAAGTTTGFVRTGETRSLPVGVDGSDRSDGVVELEVIEIRPDEAVIMEDGVERRITKAARAQGMVSVASRDAGDTAATNSKPGSQDNENTRAIEKAKQSSLAKRPNVEDFKNPDGTVDRESYVRAVREYANTTRINNTGTADDGSAIPLREGQRRNSRSAGSGLDGVDRDGGDR